MHPISYTIKNFCAVNARWVKLNIPRQCFIPVVPGTYNKYNITQTTNTPRDLCNGHTICYLLNRQLCMQCACTIDPDCTISGNGWGLALAFQMNHQLHLFLGMRIGSHCSIYESISFFCPDQAIRYRSTYPLDIIERNKIYSSGQGEQGKLT